jgi:hypothetical protein
VTVEAVIVATLLVLMGIGGGLVTAGRRYRKPLVRWSGLAILIAVLAFIAMEAFLMITCLTGAGCI